MFTKFAFLKQGDKTVTEYVTEFEALSRYGLSFIDTPAKKNEKFVGGLREDIGKKLIYHLEKRFEEIVNMAIRHETMYPVKGLVVVKEEPKPQVGGKGQFGGKV